MQTLLRRRIALGVTGGIAAYKSPQIVRRLKDDGAEVRVLMTASAKRFVGEITFQAVSGEPVHSDLLDPAAEGAMGHIELARWADLVLVAPATADFIARLAQGRADDLLAAVCLATAAPIAVVPAMNQQMWVAPATQDNVRVLRARHVHVLGPAEGDQACGEKGPGRMQEPSEIVAWVSAFFSSGALGGARVLVTAGPTREPIDTVRYLSNRSSGRMGYAIAQAARDAGGCVTLISGPAAVRAPDAIPCVLVETAAEMYEAVMRLIPDQDIFISAAAVADYAPEKPARHKLKKSRDAVPLTLLPTKDILAEVGAKDGIFTVGFAAETEDLVGNARKKLLEKNIDMIAANRVGQPGRGFDSTSNELHVLWRGGERQLPLDSKERLARDLIALIAERYREARGRKRA
jgi:phosphopantothenoylcysteine decarboxylase/phosphopantothenate--cysteine ligase